VINETHDAPTHVILNYIKIIIGTYLIPLRGSTDPSFTPNFTTMVGCTRCSGRPRDKADWWSSVLDVCDARHLTEQLRFIAGVQTRAESLYGLFTLLTFYCSP